MWFVRRCDVRVLTIATVGFRCCCGSMLFVSHAALSRVVRSAARTFQLVPLFVCVSARFLPFHGLVVSVRRAARLGSDGLTFVAGSVRSFFPMWIRTGLV